MVCDGITGEVQQSIEYLPGGHIFRSENYGTQPYMFCGKELITMHGLSQYDSNARFQHSTQPRFSSIDPLADLNYDISPYAYSSCDPVNKIDPLGLTDYYNLNGRMVHHVDDDSDDKYLVLTFENDIDAIQKIVGEGYYIFISSASFLGLIKESYNKTVKQNKEFGFMAGQKGSFSSIVTGTSNSIKKEWESAVEELHQMNDQYLFDFHTHIQSNEGNTNLSSPVDQQFSKDAQINILLGFKNVKTPINDTFPIQYNTRYQPYIVFYSRKGDITSISYSKFVSVLKKMFK